MTEDDFKKKIDQIIKNRKKILTEQKLSLKDIVGNFPIYKNEKNEILRDTYSKIDSLNRSQLEQLKQEYFQKIEEAKKNYNGSRLEVELSFLRDEMLDNFRNSQASFHQDIASIINSDALQYCNFYIDLMDSYYQEAFAGGIMPNEFQAELTGREWFTELFFSH